jgi:hypothetical protein
MKYGLGSTLILAPAIGALASLTQNVLSVSKPRPLVIWHGLGASALFLGILMRALIRLMSPPPPQMTRMTHPAFSNSDQQ